MKSAKIFIAFTFLLAFAVCVSAQGNPYPNELTGYEFFGKGKLKGLKLGASTRKTVKRIFGESCEVSCDYDENFTIRFEYLTKDYCMTTQTVRDRVVCPIRKFIGTILLVKFYPKRPFSFKAVRTSKFNILSEGSLIEKGGEATVSYSSFGDKYGLKYSVIKKISIPDESYIPVFAKGDLHSITYNLSEDLESKIFRASYMAKK